MRGCVRNDVEREKERSFELGGEHGNCESEMDGWCSSVFYESTQYKFFLIMLPIVSRYMISYYVCFGQMVEIAAFGR